MHKIITITAASLMIAGTLPAYASSDDVYCRQHADGPRLSIRDIAARVAHMGYDVRKVERDDGCYEVYATDTNGARFEIKLHPVTGEVVERERKS